MGGPQRLIVPQVRGRATTRIVAWLEVLGYRVHRVGRAVYVHGDASDLHMLLGVWDRGEEPPPWSTRLGAVSAGYARRRARRTRELGWLRLARDERGRWVGRRPWWLWPVVGAHRHEPLRWWPD
jgi:hypothetical protein